MIPPRSTRAELLDRPLDDLHELAANLADIRVVNRWLGGAASVARGLALALQERPRMPRYRLLDVATGSGDVPLALRAWGRRRGLELRLFGSDLLAEVLAAARAHTAGALPLLRHDALRLPLADRAVEIITCAQALHHFEPLAAVELLRELARAADYALVVSDLRRSWLTYVGARALAPLQRSAMSRHDGPLSALRAYTLDEARWLCAQAGLEGALVRRDGAFRLLIVWRRSTMKCARIGGE